VRILGVIDIARGRAVHARGGHRDHYAPVTRVGERVIEPGDALALADAYHDLLGIDELYIADLDAITSRRPQFDVVAGLSRRASVWLDAGIRRADDAHRAIDAGAARVIAGLETLESFEALAAIADAIGGERTVFSLDLRDGRPLCPPHLLAAATSIDAVARSAREAGTTTMILLDVARVGSGAGIDAGAIRDIRAGAPDVSLLAGGGLRGLDDVQQAAALGCAGVLVATALQDGRMTAADVAAARRLQPSVSR